MGSVQSRKLAVVTGASSGIGFALALQAAQRGYDLVICGDHEDIHAAADDITAAGAGVLAVQVDLSAYEAVERLGQQIAELGRPVDVLLLNAGLSVGGRFLDTSLEDELRMVALNVSAIVHLAKLLIPDMVSRNAGKILITASVPNRTSTPYLSVYGATRAFAMSFADALGAELESHHISVTALQPGVVDTNFFERADVSETRPFRGAQVRGTRADPPQ
jgi:short-subunit dehydrogenase